MVQRNAELSFAGGMWVFPGGRVDPDDVDPTDDDERAAARRAAAREAAEETDLTIDPDRLVELSHWTPPPESPRRFGTWFFVGEAPAGDVTVDGGEILAHRWTTPGQARERRDPRADLAGATHLDHASSSSNRTATRHRLWRASPSLPPSGSRPGS